MIMNILKSEELSVAEKERKINAMNALYVEKIKEAAKKGPDPPAEVEKKEEEEDDGTNTMLIIIAVVALVVACVAVVVGCVMLRKYKQATHVVDISLKSQEEMRAAADQIQQANDGMTVVIGQPVAASTQAGAQQGVPQAVKGASTGTLSTLNKDS